MNFRQRIMQVAILTALTSLSLGCDSEAKPSWIEIENYGASALYLDLASVRQNGQLRTFTTKLATPGWKGFLSRSEIRDIFQIDCKARTFRKLEGGIYVDGRLKYPKERLGFGKIGTKGYARLLHDRVC